MKALTIEQWPLERLKPYARDLTKQDDATVARMADLIRVYGLRLPLLATTDGWLIDGKLRLKAVCALSAEEVEALGLATLPVVPCDDLTPEEVRALRLALKRSATWAPWDEAQLAVELQELSELEIAPELMAFDQAELDKLLASLVPPAPPGGQDPGPDNYKEQYGVIVICRDEAHQKEVYEELTTAGHQCKVVVT